MWKTQAESLIKGHEGLRLKPYFDSVGVSTIGWGHNLLSPSTRSALAAVGASFPVIRLSEAQAQLLFDGDFQNACEIAGELVPSFDTLSDSQRSALADLAFNLGVGRMSGFHAMLSCIEAKDFAGAAKEMLNSKWATQVGSRATDDAELIQIC